MQIILFVCNHFLQFKWRQELEYRPNKAWDLGPKVNCSCIAHNLQQNKEIICPSSQT